MEEKCKIKLRIQNFPKIRQSLSLNKFKNIFIIEIIIFGEVIKFLLIKNNGIVKINSFLSKYFLKLNPRISPVLIKTKNIFSFYYFYDFIFINKIFKISKFEIKNI